MARKAGSVRVNTQSMLEVMRGFLQCSLKLTVPGDEFDGFVNATSIFLCLLGIVQNSPYQVCNICVLHCSCYGCLWYSGFGCHDFIDANQSLQDLILDLRIEPSLKFFILDQILLGLADNIALIIA